MQPIQEEKCYNQMAILEKYESVISYLYPIAQSMPRKHGVAREMFLQCLMGVPDLLIQAGKSNQVSKIHSIMVWSCKMGQHAQSFQMDGE